MNTDTTRRSEILRRLVAFLIAIEALYVLGLALLFPRMSASFLAFENEATRGRLVGLTTAVTGITFCGLLILTAVGLWSGWFSKDDRRRRAVGARFAAILVILLHAALGVVAVVERFWVTFGASLLIVCCVVIAWYSVQPSNRLL